MRDLSLHLLDLIENAVTAGAATVRVRVAQRPAEDLLELSIEDDGPGLRVPFETALDPFYTTKPGKRTGLGLPLFQTSVQLAGGTLELARSPAGGLAVRARMDLGHIDRLPLGDLATTLSTVAATHPEIHLACELEGAGGRVEVSTQQLGRESDGTQDGAQGSLELACRLADRIRAGLASAGLRS